MNASIPRSANRHPPCGAIFDVPNKRKELDRIGELISAPDFWSEPEKSQKVMQDRKRLEEAVESDEKVRAQMEDVDTLFELAREGEAVIPDIERELKTFEDRVASLETGMLLAGENDSLSARLIYSYRSAFLTGIVSTLPQYVDGSGDLSASLNLKITPQLSVSFDAKNLTGQLARQYVVNRDMPAAIYNNGKQFYLGLKYSL